MREGEDSNRRAKGVARYRQAVEIFRRGDLQWALRVLEPWVQELDPEQMDAWGCRGLGLAAELMLELNQYRKLVSRL